MSNPISRADGTKQWYQNGERHRTDGPAVIWADGSEEWWIEGKKVSKMKIFLEEMLFSF